MFDILRIRSDFEGTKKAMEKRGLGNGESLETLFELDKKRLSIVPLIDNMKANKNKIGKENGLLMREINAGALNAEELRQKFSNNQETVKRLNDDLEQLEVDLKVAETTINNLLLSIPNMLSNDVPFGLNEEDNIELRKHLEPREFAFKPKAHWDLVKELDIVDFERASKMVGSRFSILKKDGALLERALIRFMLDTHCERGYEEFNFPLITSGESLLASGQLPKFEEDLFKLKEDRNLYLIPTTEVQLVNYHRNEILDSSQFPLNYTGFTTNFRSEAGSAGRDTRGLIRQHQFDKVELFKYCLPENGLLELENITKDAENILDLLKLPYRVVKLCSGDTGFSATKTYDIEVWLPSYNEYKEISSCSLTTDFQSRRANIRFKRTKESKTEYPYLLNGSGLAVGRTFAAIIENYQNEDGTVEVPQVLVPYMRNKTIITK